jgi:hypothetical protein
MMISWIWRAGLAVPPWTGFLLAVSDRLRSAFSEWYAASDFRFPGHCSERPVQVDYIVGLSM